MASTPTMESSLPKVIAINVIHLPHSLCLADKKTWPCETICGHPEGRSDESDICDISKVSS